jgi:hypothetical protein
LQEIHRTPANLGSREEESEECQELLNPARSVPEMVGCSSDTSGHHGSAMPYQELEKRNKLTGQLTYSSQTASYTSDDSRVINQLFCFSKLFKKVNWKF